MTQSYLPGTRSFVQGHGERLQGAEVVCSMTVKQNVTTRHSKGALSQLRRSSHLTTLTEVLVPMMQGGHSERVWKLRPGQLPGLGSKVKKDKKNESSFLK